MTAIDRAAPRGARAALAAAALAAAAAASACSAIEERVLPGYDLPESASVEGAAYPRLADNPLNLSPEAAAEERARGEDVGAALTTKLDEMRTRADRLGDPSEGSEAMEARGASLASRAETLLQE